MESINSNTDNKVTIQQPEEFVEYYNMVMAGAKWQGVSNNHVDLNENFRQFSIYDTSCWETNANTCEILNKI